MEATFRDYGALAGVTAVHLGEAVPAGQTAASTYLPTLAISVYVPMPEEMVRKERPRIAKEIEEKRRHVASIEAKLANKQFTDRAPAEVVERERTRAAEARTAVAALEKRLGELGR